MISTPNLYPVRLDPEQRQALQDIARNGRAPVKKVRHAQVLLLSDRDRPEGKRTDPRIADALGMHVNTVARVRKLFVTGGGRPALEHEPRLTPPVPPRIDGKVEAHIIAICTGPPPGGRARWIGGRGGRRVRGVGAGPQSRGQSGHRENHDSGRPDQTAASSPTG